MSVPHTGRLIGLVNGVRVTFSGDTWTAPDAGLAESLNAATASAPRTHYDIRELAEHVCAKLAVLLQILEWKPDTWTGEDRGGVRGID